MSEEVKILESEDSQLFFSLVQMLHRSTLVHLGLVTDQNDDRHFDIQEAKAAIDILGVLQKRTSGNLEPIEEQLLQGIVTESRMRFVQAQNDQGRKETEKRDSDRLKQTFTDPENSPVETIVDDTTGEEE